MLAWLAPAARAELPTARIIVKWKTADTNRHSSSLQRSTTNLRQTNGLSMRTQRTLSGRMAVLQLDRTPNANEFAVALQQLQVDPEVEYAVADQRRHALLLPSDPLITATSGRSGQWYLLNNEVAAINAYAAWDYSQGGLTGSGTVVAVVDTGVRFDHPDLSSKLLPGYDFVDCDQSSCAGNGTHTFLTANDGDGWDADASDPGDWVNSSDQQNSVFADCDIESSSWHGTRVAGIIGAATNNGVGIAGTGWNARILPVRALGKCGGYDSDIIAGMRWAAGLGVNGVADNPYPAKIINLSLGGEGSCSAAYTDVINTLYAAGVTVVASAGNDSAIINTPANCNHVIAVTGVRNAGTKVGFSSLGAAATIAAPAGNCGTSSGACLYSIDTTTNLSTSTPGVNDYTDQTNYNLGTSFSAPIVSGTVALMLGANAALTPDQIISTLQTTATPFPSTAATTCEIPTSSTSVTINETECNCTTSTCGAGIVNAYRAVFAVSASASSSSTASSTSSSNSSSTSSAAAVAGSDGGGGGSISFAALTALNLLLGLLLVCRRRRGQMLMSATGRSKHCSR